MADVLMPVMIDDITVTDDRREVDTAAVSRLAESIKQIGLKHPITVRRKGDGYELVAGLHRVEAFKKLGHEHIPACIVSMTNTEARMWEIAENLYRSDLTKLQRAEQIEEWRKLAAQIPHQGQHGGHNSRGQSATAEALGVDRKDVRAAEKIAVMTPEAKAAAQEVGIDDNQTKLLAVAKEAPERQVAKVIELASRPAKIAPDPLNDFETKEKWMDAIMRVWNRGSKEWRDEFMSRVDVPVMDARFK